jgi:hypothetical protein
MDRECDDTPRLIIHANVKETPMLISMGMAT